MSTSRAAATPERRFTVNADKESAELPLLLGAASIGAAVVLTLGPVTGLTTFDWLSSNAPGRVVSVVAFVLFGGWLVWLGTQVLLSCPLVAVDGGSISFLTARGRRSVSINEITTIRVRRSGQRELGIAVSLVGGRVVFVGFKPKARTWESVVRDLVGELGD